MCSAFFYLNLIDFTRFDQVGLDKIEQGVTLVGKQLSQREEKKEERYVLFLKYETGWNRKGDLGTRPSNCIQTVKHGPFCQRYNKCGQ